MAIVVSEKISKTGNTITGEIKEIVIVKTALGYQPDPAYPGIGTVIGTLCRSDIKLGMELETGLLFSLANETDAGNIEPKAATVACHSGLLVPYVWVSGIGCPKPILLASTGSTSQLFNSSTVSEVLYFYHTDHLGTPLMMTDMDQNVVWQGEFLPFGEAFSITGTITNNLRFPGQYYDEETGLHQNWNRDYKPEVGRYISEDPIGLKGGINLYVYVRNNPLNLTDPMGLSPGGGTSSNSNSSSSSECCTSCTIVCYRIVTASPIYMCQKWCDGKSYELGAFWFSDSGSTGIISTVIKTFSCKNFNPSPAPPPIGPVGPGPT